MAEEPVWLALLWLQVPITIQE